MRVVLARVGRLVAVMFVVATAAYFLMQMLPGDPARTVVGAEGTPEQYEQVRRQLGLDKPILGRYVDWLDGLVHGDLGSSLVPPVQSVADMIAARLPVTLELAALAIVIALAIAVPVALLASYHEGGMFDRTSSTIAFGLISVPSFVLALGLVILLVFNPDYVRVPVVVASVWVAGRLTWKTLRAAGGYPHGRPRRMHLGKGLGGAAALILLASILWAVWPDFPRQGFVRLSDGGPVENLRSILVPALSLALIEAAVFMRVLRGDLTQTLKEDFVLSAKAKGMPAHRVLTRDALRPSSFSIVTVAGVALGQLLGGTVIIETIFNLPGMGSMLIDAIYGNDYSVVLGGVLVIALVYVTLNAVVDAGYFYLDPRVRRGRG